MRVRSGSWAVVVGVQGVLVALVASMLVLFAQAAAAPTATRSAVSGSVPASGDGAAELAEAERTGSPVVVDEWTTETTEVAATPAGQFQARISASPVRTEIGGAWVDLDSTLERRPDGMVEPKVAAGEVELSGGGAADSVLAKISRDGATYVVRTPWKLPAPSLHEGTAVYAEVLPGLDLVSTASANGFSFNWVVKSRAAADDPRVRKLSLPVELSGITGHSESGGLSFVDADGVRKFWTPTPTMWDSSGASTADPITGRSSETSLAAVDDGPDMKDHVSKVAATMTQDKLTLTPDTSMLDADDVVFPVVIDPSMTYPKTRNGWTAVWNNFPTKSFWQTEHSLGAGYEGFEQFKIVRSYFRFDTSGIKGKKIIDAEMNVRQIHAASCQARTTDVYRTGAIGTSTTWNAQPTRSTLQSSSSSTAGCGSGTATVGWNVTQGAEVLANANAATGTFMIRARDEGDKIAWKQFDDDGANLVVTYVSKPAVPSAVTLKTANGTVPCGTSTTPAVVGSLSVTPGAKVTSADGASAALRGVFKRRNMTTANDLPDVAGIQVASGDTSTATWAVTNGHTYRFVAKNRVYWSEAGVTKWLDSAYTTTYCYFRVDTTRPAPPALATTSFTQCATPEVPDECASAGEAGVAGSFTADAAEADAVKYHWSLNGVPGSDVITTNGDLRSLPPVTPTQITNTLRVWSEDQAGNLSIEAIYIFRVGPRAVDVNWDFNDSAAPGADTGRNQTAPLTLGTTSSVDLGRVEEGLTVSGGAPATSAITPTSGVSATTAFTIGAWVRLDAPASGATTTLLAATTSASNVFEFGYEPAAKTWTAGRRSAVTTNLAASSSATLGVWTHLAATYDPVTKKLSLFVNGTLASTVVYTSAAWASTGWRIGCGGLGGVDSSCAGGRIDEVNLYSTTLAPDEIQNLAEPLQSDGLSPVAAPAAAWAMDDPDDSLVAVESCFDSDLAVANVPSPRFGTTGDGLFRTLLLPDATDRAVKIAHPAVDSTGSFTVAANVRPADSTRSMVIAQQRGVNRDSWTLAYEADPAGGGRWVFQRTSADTGTATVTEVRSPLVPSVADELAVVIATYDRKHDRIALFVNGRTFTPGPDPAVDELPEASFNSLPWAARNDFLVGSGTLNGTSAPFTGEVERVDIFTGFFDESLALSYNTTVWQ